MFGTLLVRRASSLFPLWTETDREDSAGSEEKGHMNFDCFGDLLLLGSFWANEDRFSVRLSASRNLGLVHFRVCPVSPAGRVRTRPGRHQFDRPPKPLGDPPNLSSFGEVPRFLSSSRGTDRQPRGWIDRRSLAACAMAITFRARGWPGGVCGGGKLGWQHQSNLFGTYKLLEADGIWCFNERSL